MTSEPAASATRDAPLSGIRMHAEHAARFLDWSTARSIGEHTAEIARALALRSLGTETVLVEHAQDRVLACDVRAPFGLPAFDNSQMDGFALDSAHTPGTFAVTGMIPAGSPGVEHAASGGAARATAAVGPAGEPPRVSAEDAPDLGGETAPNPAITDLRALPCAAPIMTGAPMPEWADAVVPVEETEGFDAASLTVGEVAAGRFVRPLGSDITAGELALTAGTALHPAALGLLSALGLTEVVVRQCPRVLVVTGGDEVVPPGRELQPGQIFDANRTLLQTVLARCGALVAGSLTVTDTVADFRTLLTRAVADSDPDLIVTSGGISAGRFEVVRQAFEPAATEHAADMPAAAKPLASAGTAAGETVDLDPEVGFGSVLMQPGGPQGVGVLRMPAGTAPIPVVCFPGNPVSTWTSAQLLLRQTFADVWGVCSPLLQVEAVLDEDVPSLPAKTQVRRAVLAPAGARLTVRALPGTSSHLLAGAAHANAFLLVPPGRGSVPAGEILTAVLLRP